MPDADLVAALVLVPLDGSPLADRAVAVARRLLDPGSGRLLLVGVASETDATEVGDHLREVAASVAPVPAETLVVPGGDAASVIAAVAGTRDATVCMTSHGRGRWRRSVLGSVAEGVVARAARPVVLVGPRCDPSWTPSSGPVLVANGEAALPDPVADVSCAAARRFGTSVLLATVIHPLDVEGAEHPDAVFARGASEIRTRGIEVATRMERAHAPGVVLADVARERGSPVVVTAAHRRGAVANVVLGSTTMALVHAATCPVVVVPERAATAAHRRAERARPSA